MSRHGDAEHVLWPDPDQGPWLVSARFQTIDGRMECIDIQLRAYRPTEMSLPLPEHGLATAFIDAKLWRSVPVASITHAMKDRSRIRLAHLLEQQSEDPTVSAEAVALGREILDALEGHTEVARVYLAATGAPTRAVASHFSITQSAAANRVLRARKAGAIPPTTKGRNGGRPRPTKEPTP